MGQYTNKCHEAMKISIGQYFIRSAKLPQIRAGVIIAKVSWYMQYTHSYVDGEVRLIGRLDRDRRIIGDEWMDRWKDSWR